jgi:O-antigen ligase
MAFAVPWGSLDTMNLHGLNLNAADLLVGFLAVGWLMSWVMPAYLKGIGPRDREKGQLPLYLILAMFALIGVMVLSMTVAISKKDSLKEIFKWLEFLTLVLLGAQYLRTRRDIWTLVTFLLVAAISQALYGYAQAVFSLGPASFVRSFNLRVYGTFNQPNPYAGYLNMALVVALSLTLLGRNWLTRIGAGLATCLIGGAFYLTQSRGGQVALIAALIFILLAGVRSMRTWIRVVLIGLLAVVAGMVAGVIPLYLFNQVNRFLGLTGISLTAPNPADYSTAERLAHWIAGLRMYAAHPVLGVGIGNYPDAYSQYYVTIFVNSLGQAHNYYINIAAETGTIGLIIYLLFVLAMLWAGGSAVHAIGRAYWQARQQLPRNHEHIQAPPGKRQKLHLLLHPARLLQYYRRPSVLEAFGQLTNDRALAIGLMASLITVCVHNLVDDLYDHSMTNLLALLLIALIRLGTITTYEPVESRQGSRASTVGVGPQPASEYTRVAAQVHNPR